MIAYIQIATCSFADSTFLDSMHIMVNRVKKSAMSSYRPALWQIPLPRPLSEQVERQHQGLFDRLSLLSGQHQTIRFASSMAAEDMVLIDAMVKVSAPVEIFTLDTGRLHLETLDMVKTAERYYGLSIRRVQPDPSDVEAFIHQHSLNGFYDSEDAKIACCRARKVLPLDKALNGADAWVTGQRQEQSVTRIALQFAEQDHARGIAKYNPLFDWSDADVWTYLDQHGVPIHPLHRQGYPSIGCEPCTRAIRADEETRAGRWWWLQQANKECGLHVK